MPRDRSARTPSAPHASRATARFFVEGDRRRAWIVFAVLFASFAWFYQGIGPNQNSRFDLVRAVVDRKTFAIDAYAKNTIDKAEANGHVYSDKAPGLSFAAAPVYLFVRVVQGFGTPTRDSARHALYLLTTIVVGAVSALGGAAAYLFLRRLRVGVTASVVAVIAWSIGSNHFAYATIFVAHAFTGALLVLAFTRLHAGRSPRAVALAGFLGAWAAISEYPAGVIGAFLFFYGVRKHGLRAMIPFFAAASVPLVLLGVYDAACFGSPFTLGYSRLSNPEFQDVIATGFFGLRLPSPSVLWRLLVSEHRGLLPLSPWALACVPGFVLLFRARAREHRPEAVFLLASSLFLFLLCGSYARWDGGMAMGPRYVVPALPFVAIASAFAFDAISRSARIVAGAAVFYAVVVCTACVAVMPEFPDIPIPIRVEDMPTPDPEHPLTTLVLPLALRGFVSVKGTTPEGRIAFAIGFNGHGDDAINLGERLGFRGFASLLPLVVVWLIAIAAFVDRRSRQSTQSLS